MLSELEAVAFLIERGYISRAETLGGGLRLISTSRRHVGIAVTRTQDSGLFLKQGLREEGFGTVRHEAEILDNLACAPLPRKLCHALPRAMGYHAGEDLLVLELVQNARDLRSRLRRCRVFPRLVLRRLGETLGLLHRSSPDQNSSTGHPHRPPWVLSLHRPRLALLREASAGNLRLITILQEDPDLCARLDELRQAWCQTSFIHFDVKFDNVVVFAATKSSRATRLKLVDWEFAGRGDPCWDVGSVFAEFLCLWLRSVPVMDPLSLQPRLDLAGRPLESLRPAVKSFWSAYLRASGREDVNEYLYRSVCYAAARMLQTAYEMTQGVLRPTVHAGYLVQVAANLLLRPEEAAHCLLDLAPE